MRVEGTYSYPAPLDRVWARLTDPGALRECIPGCEDLTASGPDRWDATLMIGVGPVRGRYTGSVAIVEKNEPLAYRLLVEGHGGPGFVRATADITLAAEVDGTRVEVRADGQVGGTMAAVGQRMLTGVARTLMTQFFACVKDKL